MAKKTFGSALDQSKKRGLDALLPPGLGGEQSKKETPSRPTQNLTKKPEDETLVRWNINLLITEEMKAKLRLLHMIESRPIYDVVISAIEHYIKKIEDERGEISFSFQKEDEREESTSER